MQKLSFGSGHRFTAYHRFTGSTLFISVFPFCLIGNLINLKVQINDKKIFHVDVWSRPINYSSHDRTMTPAKFKHKVKQCRVCVCAASFFS